MYKIDLTSFSIVCKIISAGNSTTIELCITLHKQSKKGYQKKKSIFFYNTPSFLDDFDCYYMEGDTIRGKPSTSIGYIWEILIKR